MNIDWQVSYSQRVTDEGYSCERTFITDQSAAPPLHWALFYPGVPLSGQKHIHGVFLIEQKAALASSKRAHASAARWPNRCIGSCTQAARDSRRDRRCWKSNNMMLDRGRCRPTNVIALPGRSALCRARLIRQQRRIERSSPYTPPPPARLMCDGPRSIRTAAVGVGVSAG